MPLYVAEQTWKYNRRRDFNPVRDVHRGDGRPVNRLFYGDCLEVMPTLATALVDLIYLDPPFNSNRAYNAIYRDSTGRPLPVRVEAFCKLPPKSQAPNL